MSFIRLPFNICLINIKIHRLKKYSYDLVSMTKLSILAFPEFYFSLGNIIFKNT